MKEAAFRLDHAYIGDFSALFHVELDGETYRVDLGYSDAEGFDIDVQDESGEDIDLLWFMEQFGYEDKGKHLFGDTLTQALFETRYREVVLPVVDEEALS